MKRPGHREIWEAALTLTPYEDLASSLVRELSEYLDISEAETTERCRRGAERVSDEWRDAAPSEAGDIADFYRETDSYLYDLTWWHALIEDESVLATVATLESALEHRCKTVLDFGSGIGSLGLLMAHHGMDVTLADINPTLNDYARYRFERRGLPVRTLDASYENLPEASFDFVCAMDVLEHLPDPASVLESLTAALKPGGTLFVHLPREEDSSRPMHLWHGTNALLEHVGEAGLWLENADESSVTLRRGNAPRYTLNRGIEIAPTKKGAVLLSRRPLMATPLNDRAADMLESLDDGKTAAELSTESRLSLTETMKFLDGLAAKRILVREREVLAPRSPDVTVVVPAKDRPAQTRACVESVLNADYPSELLEVIVVDDASEPPLSESLSDLPVRIIRTETNIGQSAARNLAAHEAKGEVLAFTDNDCEAERGWLKALLVHLCEPGIDVVGGRILSPEPDGNVAAFEAVRSSLDMGKSAGMVGFGEAVVYLPTCNLAVDRGAYLELGGMDEGMSLGEDADFVWRAISSGSGVYYEPEAGVVHHHRTRLPELLRRRADYASSEADLQHRHSQSRRLLMIPVVGTMLLALLALSVVSWRSGVVVTLISWQLGAILTFVTATILTVEITTKLRKIRQTGVEIPAHDVAAAVARQHGAGLYHLGANVCRYYSLPLFVVSVFFWPLLVPLLVVMAIPAVVDHRRSKPEVSLPVFVLLYWLELSAYQIGVWRGCIERRTFRPLFAKIRFSR